ncbi:MAG: hypothetical protein Q4F41_07990 [Eubacteriales bacterium]|nr:hypothetical protein [Eubacteriales bacterium]
MNYHDTVSLLRECDAGTKMAVSSIDEVLSKVSSPDLKQLLTESKKHHEKLGNDIHSLLEKHKSDEKEPEPIAKGMAWLKTNVKITLDDSDAAIADLLTDGCNMGTKSLHKYLNQYNEADHSAKQLCNRLVDLEEQLCKDLHSYL